MTNDLKLGFANAAVAVATCVVVVLGAAGVVYYEEWDVELSALILLVIFISIPLTWHFAHLDQVVLARKGRRFSDRTFACQDTRCLRELIHVEGRRLRSIMLPTDVPGCLAEPLTTTPGTTHQIHDSLPFPKVRFIRRMRGGLTGIPTGVYFLEDADVAKGEPQYWRVAAVTELELPSEEQPADQA